MADEIKSAKAGLATLLKAGLIKRVYSYPPDSIAEEPAAVILIDGINNQIALGGSTFQAMFRVVILIAAGKESQAIDNLDKIASPLGTNSLEAIVDADRTWGASVDDGRLVSTGPQRRVTIGAQDFFAQDFVLKAILKITT